MTDSNQEKPVVNPPIPASANTATPTGNSPGTETAMPAVKDSGSWGPAMAILALMLACYSLYRIEFSPSSADGIYIVDGIRLTRSYQVKAESERLNGNKTAEQINQEAYAMEQAINKQISDMAAAGKVVLQKQSVLAYPPGTDITAQIAQSLSIPLIADSGYGRPAQLPGNNRNGNMPPDSLPADAGQSGGAELD